MGLRLSHAGGGGRVVRERRNRRRSRRAVCGEITAKNGANLTKTEESAAAIVDRTVDGGEATLRVVTRPASTIPR